jgi:hypothetical protein
MIYLPRSVIVLLLVVALPVAAQVTFSDRAFRESGTSKGTVLLQVNWGRYWKCGHYENAQLQRLAFRRIDLPDGAPIAKDWELSPFSTLMTKPSFEPYVVVLDPGKYALSGFKFKVAASVSDVRVAEVGPAELIVGGKPVGGSFTVGAGEAVYIGHFGVDCNGEPTPWRFHVEGKDAFAEYVDGFHKRYPFAKNVPVTFRLFKTERLGQPYELPR